MTLLGEAAKQWQGIEEALGRLLSTRETKRWCIRSSLFRWKTPLKRLMTRTDLSAGLGGAGRGYLPSLCAKERLRTPLTITVIWI